MILEGDVLLAYIDPFTGAIILQVIVAGALSASATFRRFLVTPVAALYRRLRGKSAGPGDTENREEGTD